MLLKMYIQSSKGVLVEVSSQMRVPRTYKRFAGLMGEWSGCNGRDCFFILRY